MLKNSSSFQVLSLELFECQQIRISVYLFTPVDVYLCPSDACGGVFEDSNGTITSPSFPVTYPGNKDCVWEIIAPPQYRITLNFTHFDLEGNNARQQDCEYDSVEVSSKLGDDLLRKHGIFCGSRLPSLITSEGNSLRVTFTSDNR